MNLQLFLSKKPSNRRVYLFIANVSNLSNMAILSNQTLSSLKKKDLNKKMTCLLLAFLPWSVP